jgi:hypothetical protein
MLVHNARVQEIANDLCDFASMRIQCEVAGVEEAHVSAWNVMFERFNAGRHKEWCVRKYFLG